MMDDQSKCPPPLSVDNTQVGTRNTPPWRTSQLQEAYRGVQWDTDMQALITGHYEQQYSAEVPRP